MSKSDKMAPAVDTLVAMTDAFEGIDRLAEGAPKTDGAPNFRRVSFLYLRSLSASSQMSARFFGLNPKVEVSH